MARQRWKFRDSGLAFVIGQLAENRVAVAVVGIIVGGALAIAFIR